VAATTGCPGPCGTEVLLDEPLSNLDAKLRERMRFEIKSLVRRMDITSVYVTHDQAEAMVISDRIAVMDTGNIVQVGAPEEIYKKPANRFVADFIGTTNFIPGEISEVLKDRDLVYIHTEFGQKILCRMITADGQSKKLTSPSV
jgi:iron(III) transport system ATP-binding protein